MAIIEHRGSHLHISQITLEQELALKTRFTLPNPKYIGAIKAGKIPRWIPQVLAYWEAAEYGMRIPVGGDFDAGKILNTEIDCPLSPQKSLETQFHGNLRLYQVAATEELLRHKIGILHVPTGGGKTVMACHIVAARAVRTLVVVPGKTLQQQWADAIAKWLPEASIGGLGGNLPNYSRPDILVAIINSAAKMDQYKLDRYEHIVIDECHRAAATSYQKLLGRFCGAYRTGLTATPWRSDGLDDAIRWQLGETIEVERSRLVRTGHLLPIRVTQIPTQFETELNASENYSQVINELISDNQRNYQIAMQIRRQLDVTLVLSDRQQHVELLAKLADSSDVIVAHGGLNAAARREAEERIRNIGNGDATKICATAQLLGEGFDLPVANTLILATPMKFDGRLIQAIGRVLRPSPGQKEGRIIDFADWLVPQLAASARTRARVYGRIMDEEQLFYHR